MRILLNFLCAMCVTPGRALIDGSCPRRDPPRGALILSPGSDLVLTCSGHVTVDGVKVRKSSNTKRIVGVSQTTINSKVFTGALVKSEKPAVENAVSHISQNRSLRHGDTGYTASPSAHRHLATSVQAEEMDGRSDHHDHKEEGSKGTRDINLRHQWKWTRRAVGRREQGEATGRGDTLSLSSVRLTDSGTYSCYHGGTKRFSLKVIIADPPEKPRLSCYKKSPSSKIRCEWMPQKPVTIRPDCYLLLRKSPTEAFLPLRCSFSSRASRCWCSLDYNEDELRTLHLVYLCVTSIAGNATSSLLHFTPLRILKPDPPANVSVRQEEGQETRLRVSWNLPASWKPQDNYFELMYELRYRPLVSSLHHTQMQRIRARRSYYIPDAMPGVEYLIQLRTKEEYDGLWSDWSVPVFATSWTASVPTTTMIPLYVDDESSGAEDSVTEVAPTFSAVWTQPVEVSPDILWISGSFAVFSVILAAYIFRHKNRFMTKLQSLSVVAKCGAPPPPPPSAATAPESQALVSLRPPSHKECRAEEKEEEDTGQRENEQMSLNNTNDFFFRQ